MTIRDEILDVSDPVERGEKLMSLWDSFEALFHRKVDLLTISSIRNPVLKESINFAKALIYESDGSKFLKIFHNGKKSVNK